MKTLWQVITLSLFLLVLTGCPEKTPTEKQDHFLKEKTDTIKKAEQVDQILQDAAGQQRRNIEDQGG